MHKRACFQENGMHKILVVVKNKKKTCCIMVFALPAEY